MVILLILLSSHIIIWKYNKKYTLALLNLSFFIIFSLLFCLIIFQAELLLNNIKNSDYGSDAVYYWNAMVSVYLGEINLTQVLAPLYVGWGVLVLKFSPFISILFVKLSNVLLYSLSANMLYVIVLERLSKFGFKNNFYGLVLSIIFLSNGIIFWTVIRNLKETLFIFSLIFYIFLLDKTANMKNRKYFKIISITFLSIVFYFALDNIRPLGGSLAIVLLLGNLLNKYHSDSLKIYKGRTVVLIFVLAMILFLNLLSRIYLINAFRELYMENLEKFSQSNLLVNNLNIFRLLPLSMLRFILGPGPFRGLRQLFYRDVFLVSTRWGDILIFWGSIIWWISLIIIVFNFIYSLKNRLYVVKYFIDFLIFCLIFLVVYSYIGSGTGDTRLRSVFYFFSFPFFILSFINYKKQRLY